jgi:hypothetical protein
LLLAYLAGSQKEDINGVRMQDLKRRKEEKTEEEQMKIAIFLRRK